MIHDIILDAHDLALMVVGLPALAVLLLCTASVYCFVNVAPKARR